MLTVRSCLDSCARLFPGERLVLGKTMSKITKLPQQKTTTWLRISTGEVVEIGGEKEKDGIAMGQL